MPAIVGTLKTPRLSAAPGSPVGGQMYYDTGSNLLLWWNGTAWVSAAGSGDVLKVDKDSVVAAATRIVASKLLAGDAQPAFQILGNGFIQWGAGGASAVETTLYRNAARSLYATGSLYLEDSLIVSYTDTGRIYFGSALDTSLYRFAAGFLATPGSFMANGQVAGQISLQAPGGLPTIFFGSAQDTNLYRAAANVLQTDDSLILNTGQSLSLNRGDGTNPQIEFGYGSAYQSYRHFISTTHHGGVDSGNTIDFWIWRSSLNSAGQAATARALRIDGTGSLWFANALDTNLYRKGANVLGTDWTFRAGQDVGANCSATGAFTATSVIVGHSGSALAASILFGNAADCNLYRAAAAQLKTDGNFLVGYEVYARQGSVYAVTIGAIGPSSQAGIGFGNPIDASLYRSGAKNLAFDGFLFGTDTAGQAIFGTRRTGDAGWRWYISTDGAMNWGAAAGSYDTSLYRSAAGELKTDNWLESASRIVANHGTANAVHVGITAEGTTSGISFGSNPGDTNLYRRAATVLRSDGSIESAIRAVANAYGFVAFVPETTNPYWPYAMWVVGEAWPRLAVNQVGTILLGSGAAAYDTNLYRDISMGYPTVTTNVSVKADGFVARLGIGGAWSNRFNIGWNGTANLYIDSTWIGQFAYTSDLRSKKEIQPLSSMWAAVKELSPVSYRWRDLGVFVDDGETHIGFIAQDVERAIPDGVSKAPGDTEGEQPMALDLAAILSAVTKALQEAMTRIEALEAKA